MLVLNESRINEFFTATSEENNNGKNCYINIDTNIMSVSRIIVKLLRNDMIKNNRSENEIIEEENNIIKQYFGVKSNYKISNIKDIISIPSNLDTGKIFILVNEKDETIIGLVNRVYVSESNIIITYDKLDDFMNKLEYITDETLSKIKNKDFVVKDLNINEITDLFNLDYIINKIFELKKSNDEIVKNVDNLKKTICSDIDKLLY